MDNGYICDRHFGPKRWRQLVENASGRFAVSYIKRPKPTCSQLGACVFFAVLFLQYTCSGHKIRTSQTGGGGPFESNQQEHQRTELCRMRDMGVDISHVTSLKSHEPSVHGTLVFNGTKRIFSDPYQLSNFTAVEFLRIEKKAHKVCLKVLSLPWFFTRNPD